ncbi:MAG TPA: hypothetical protein VGD29_08385, partial [Actinoplanes sp.]
LTTIPTARRTSAAAAVPVTLEAVGRGIVGGGPDSVGHEQGVAVAVGGGAAGGYRVGQGAQLGGRKARQSQAARQRSAVVWATAAAGRAVGWASGRLG